MVRVITIDNNYLQHSMKAVVTVNDSDFLGRAKPSAIMGYFQDIATEHANIIGIGYDEMSARNLGWVLIRMSFKILRTPKLGEELVIRTFPEKPNKFDVNRGYYIFDELGENIVLGSSKWCVLNMDTQRLGRISPIFAEFDDGIFIPSQPFDDANPKLGAVSECAVRPERVFSSDVRLTELDRYFHMNNARYGDIIFNAHEIDFLRTHRIARLDVNYTTQLFMGDSYEVNSSHADNISHLEAVKLGANAVVFRARAEFCEEKLK